MVLIPTTFFFPRPFNRRSNRFFQPSESPVASTNEHTSNDSTSHTNNNHIESNGQPSLNNLNNNPIDEPFIIHPGAISSILNLLPTVTSETDKLVCAALD